MKNSKKASALLLCGMMSMTMLAGCGGGGGDSTQEKVDNTMAQLYVFNYDGGVGHAWLDAAIERFETMHANTEFVEGTKGVQIWVDNKKQGGDALAATVPSSRDQVFFVENLNYMDFAYQGIMLDITDMMEEKLTDYGETRSIADKLTSDQKSYYNINGVYYGMPHYEGYNGISYDVDLFDQKKLFFGADGNLGFTSKSKNLSVGIDGKAGTYDDGLPTTYAEFYTLCDKILSLGMTPIQWSGFYQFYFTCLMTALVADCAGDEAETFYRIGERTGTPADGESWTTSRLIDSVDASGNITYQPATELSLANGYKMYSHEAFYYALSFCETLIKKNYYSPSSFSGNCMHTDAQDNFLLSRFDSSKDIAMLVEGSWWQSEASGTFEMMENSYINAGKKDRRIGFMPLPKPTAAHVTASGNQSYLKDDNYTVSFINAKCDPKIIPLAKEFLQFCRTDASLAEFTKITSCMLGFEYQISDSDYESLSYFAQSVYDLRQEAKVIHPYSSSEFFYRNKTAMTDLFNVTRYSHPTTAMMNSGETALGYYNLMQNKYSAEVWQQLYSK